LTWNIEQFFHLPVFERAVEPDDPRVAGQIEKSLAARYFTQPRVALMVQRAFIYNPCRRNKRR